MSGPQPAPADRPLHGDDPAAAAEGVRNYTAEEYAATYADGEPHTLPPAVLAALPAGDE